MNEDERLKLSVLYKDAMEAMRVYTVALQDVLTRPLQGSVRVRIEHDLRDAEVSWGYLGKRKNERHNERE